MRISKLVTVIACIGMPFMLTACYEDTNYIEFQSGIYKGADDQLLTSAPDANTLNERFNSIQTDR